MADIVGVDFNYTYNGTLLTEVMFKPSVATPAISDLARIIPGSNFKIQIPTSGIISKIVKGGKGCGRTVTGEGLNLENTTVDLNPMKMFVQECAETFEGTVGNILAEEWLRDGEDRNDISGTQLQSTIDTLLEDALRRDLFRIFSFGDLASVSPDYSQMQGLWPTLIANSGGPGYCIPRPGTALGNGDLASGVALEALKAVYQGANNILDQMPENMKAFWVTRSIYDNLVSSYESVSTGSDLQVTLQTDGIPVVRYRGVVVNKVASWDEDLSDLDNPLNGVVSHLILYDTRDNNVVGVANEGDLNRIDGWYSKDDDIYNFASKMRMGYNFVHCDLASIAY